MCNACTMALERIEREAVRAIERKRKLVDELAEWHDLYVMRTGDLYGLSKLDRDDVETLLKIIEEARRV